MGCFIFISYFYDKENIWKKNTGSGTTRYLGAGAIDQWIACADSSGLRWYLTDRLGSVSGTIDSNGTVISSTTYDSYGGITNQTNPSLADSISFAAPEAQFKIGKLKEDQADFLTAFESFQKLVENYPSCSYFTPSLDEEFRIANLYLSDEPQFGGKIAMDKAIALFQQVIKNAPYGRDAAQAQFNIGLAQEKEGKYQDSVDSYERLIKRFPTSELAPIAQYQIGYAWMRSASEAAYDQSASQKAIDAFQDFIVKYPDSNKTAQAQDNIKKLSNRKA